ncbi:glycosyltransferase [Methylobacterium sp. P31]
MSEASVVICAYTEHRWDELQAAVASVKAQTCSPKEIFVVVDGNLALLRRAARTFDGVRVVPNNNRPGLCGERVTGAEARYRSRRGLPR